MSYRDLNTDERRSEANRILVIIAEQVDDDELSDRETEFLGEVGIMGAVSLKQLYWLRGITQRAGKWPDKKSA